MTRPAAALNLPPPGLQVNFALKLVEARGHVLQDALKSTVKALDIEEIDKQLARHAPKPGLAALASHGLRGELVFPVPLILHTTPRLFGYYRLLYGYSQKLFYGSGTGMGRFKAMEVKGTVPPSAAPNLEGLCDHLGSLGAMLLAGVGSTEISDHFLHDLTLLTLGAQWRGSVNNDFGKEGIEISFGIIREIVRAAIVTQEPNRLVLKNAAGRKVLIEIAADPDVRVGEEMTSGQIQKLVAIEVKGGRDFSNIHNRLGEAEKSHQKAKAEGFIQCWTIVNVARTDLEKARRASPTTNRFYILSELTDQKSKSYIDFQDQIQAVTGIKHSKRKA